MDAQWYVGLVVALAMGRVQYVGLKPTITRHNIDRTTQVPMHEDFCAAMGQQTGLEVALRGTHVRRASECVKLRR